MIVELLLEPGVVVARIGRAGADQDEEAAGLPIQFRHQHAMRPAGDVAIVLRRPSPRQPACEAALRARMNSSSPVAASRIATAKPAYSAAGAASSAGAFLASSAAALRASSRSARSVTRALAFSPGIGALRVVAVLPLHEAGGAEETGRRGRSACALGEPGLGFLEVDVVMGRAMSRLDFESQGAGPNGRSRSGYSCPFPPA